jgi:hypothetical protein
MAENPQTIEEFEYNVYKELFDDLYKEIVSRKDPAKLTQSQLKILDDAVITGRKYQVLLAETRGPCAERQRIKDMMSELINLRTDPKIEIVPDPGLEERTQ